MSLHDTQPDDDIQRQYDYAERLEQHCDQSVDRNIDQAFRDMSFVDFKDMIDDAYDENSSPFEDLWIALRGIPDNHSYEDLQRRLALCGCKAYRTIYDQLAAKLKDDAVLSFGDET